MLVYTVIIIYNMLKVGILLEKKKGYKRAKIYKYEFKPFLCHYLLNTISWCVISQLFVIFFFSKSNYKIKKK